MRTKEDYIGKLKSNAKTLKAEYGVDSMRIFGSVARNTQTENSDVDICVCMAPKMLTIIRMKNFLESLLHTSVDVVRMHPNMNPFLKEEIERDGIVVF